MCGGAAFYSAPKAMGAPGGWTGVLGAQWRDWRPRVPGVGSVGSKEAVRGVWAGGQLRTRATALPQPLSPPGGRSSRETRSCQLSGVVRTQRRAAILSLGDEICTKSSLRGNITTFLPIFIRELEAQKGQMTLEPDWRQGAVTEPHCACIQTRFWAFGELPMGPRLWGVSRTCGCAGSLGARVCRQGGKDSCSTTDPEPGMQPPSGVSPPRGSVPMQDTDVSESGVWGASF